LITFHCSSSKGGNCDALLLEVRQMSRQSRSRPIMHQPTYSTLPQPRFPSTDILAIGRHLPCNQLDL